jgi:hypothetical protein
VLKNGFRNLKRLWIPQLSRTVKPVKMVIATTAMWIPIPMTTPKTKVFNPTRFLFLFSTALQLISIIQCNYIAMKIKYPFNFPFPAANKGFPPPRYLTYPLGSLRPPVN